MISSPQSNGRSAKDGISAAQDCERSAANEDVSALRRDLQEKRRAMTLLHAEKEKERELREALEAQLIEANAEIVSSWNRRKEMSRLLAQLQAEGKEAQKRISNLEQMVAGRDLKIFNREEKIKQLKAEIAARYEELAALQRHIVQSTLTGRAKRAARQAKGFVRKTFSS